MTNLTNLVGAILHGGRYLGLLAAVAAPSANAVTQEIRALFTPDSANPQRNQFINKTPVSGYCAENVSQCELNNMFSIRLPIGFTSRPVSYTHLTLPTIYSV